MRKKLSLLGLLVALIGLLIALPAAAEPNTVDVEGYAVGCVLVDPGKVWDAGNVRHVRNQTVLGEVYLWDAATGEPLPTLTTYSELYINVDIYLDTGDSKVWAHYALDPYDPDIRGRWHGVADGFFYREQPDLGEFNYKINGSGDMAGWRIDAASVSIDPETCLPSSASVARRHPLRALHDRHCSPTGRGA